MRRRNDVEIVIEEARLRSGKTKEEVAIAAVGNTSTWHYRMERPSSFRYEEALKIFQFLGMDKEQRVRFQEAMRSD